MQDIWVWSLGWEDPLEKDMATHSSILAWKTPWTEKPGRLCGVAKSWTQLNDCTTSMIRTITVWFHLHKESTVVRFNETGSRMMVARGCVEWDEGLMGTGFQFGKMENFRRWVVVMVTPTTWRYYYFLIKSLSLFFPKTVYMFSLNNFVVVVDNSPREASWLDHLQSPACFLRFPLSTKVLHRYCSWPRENLALLLSLSMTLSKVLSSTVVFQSSLS